MLCLLVFLFVFKLTAALPAWLDSGIHLVSQAGSDNEFDPSDLSFITKLAAIGDSYSAGIGAGDRLGSFLDALNSQGDWACSRYDHAYPYLVNSDPSLGDVSKRTFQFLSCSGALSKDVLEKQIPKLSSNQQVILLSVGGNDVELVNILNQCIFQFAVLNSQQVAVAKAAVSTDEYAWAKDFDFDTLGRGCASQLDHTASIIGSNALSESLDKVLSAAKGKLATDGKIYMTGYGKFFAEDLTSDCDHVTWTTWIYKTFNMFQDAQYLTQDNRRRMNGLVDSVNAELKAAAERAGPSVVFVDYDSYVGEFHGRYCEAGVDEATTESNTRIPLMFYELNSLDPLGSTPWKRTSAGEISDTFAGTLDIFAQITLLLDKDAQYKIPQANVTSDKPPAAAAGVVSNLDLGDFDVPNILLDGYGRVFHPQVLLHQIIANLILFEMSSTNTQSHGLPAPPRDLAIDACPYIPPMPTLHSTTTNTFGSIYLSITAPPGSSCVKTSETTICKVPREPCDTLITCTSWEASAVVASTKAPPPPPSTTSTVPVNTPPPKTTCNGNDSDCRQYTCVGGKKARCGQNDNGDPFTMYCKC